MTRFSPGCCSIAPLPRLYNLLMRILSPDQDRKVCEMLVGAGWTETQESLEGQGILAIARILDCSREEAKEILVDAEHRNVICRDITQGGELDARRPMPIAQWRWTRPRG
jgi:hypothetical protein